ncbi:Na+/H+ antiporter [Granulicella arctica]|uniref:CPA1 family monovalent cation:H+ antiporter n=1 Tax=Granulicella arctica TaxID=940613 RepID=A0A7Y9TI33_9BACT|nr:Na+/H+ antiporter [Granulicella arctica]NYF81174.1 CPA1 family monovalent cation:H+ antiporter [Granulicella arctica]
MFGSSGVHAVQTVFLLLLLMVAIFALVARRLKISYPIVLVVAGLIISFVPHIPRIPLSPDLVFLIFLPPLLYSSAWTMSWREFRHNLLTITMLAVGLVAFTVWGVAEFADRFITLLDWKSGFVLGAVVSTTDAIAATSIARTLGLPRRIVDILEGESLLNDATGLLALEFGLQMVVRGETPTAGAAVLRLLYLVFAGIGIGLLIGLVVGWWERFIDDGPIEIVVSLIVPYVAYLAGEGVHASGVLAVVACGLYLSRKSATYLTPAARIQIYGVWDALTFMMNGIVFVLIGLQLPYVLGGIRELSRLTLFEYGAGFSLILIALRMLWVFPVAQLIFWIRKRFGRNEERPGARGMFVIGWTGMRGVIALAAAISLPETLANGAPFGARNLIVFLTFSVILVTLVVQGLTLPPLIRALGLSGASGMGTEELEARRIMLEEALVHLEAGRIADGESFAHVYEDLTHRYRHRLAAVGGEVEDEHDHSPETYQRLREIARSAVQAERRAMIRLRNEGRMSDDAMRTMERELDLAESRYQAIRLD